LEIKSPCRNDRVSASIPIQVSWTGRRGEQIDGVAKTLTISRNGATIVLSQKLVPIQEITVRCAGTDKFVTARVVGLVGQEAGGHIYGVTFIDSNVNLWDIELPPATEPENAKSPVFLECASCLTRAWVDLDEIQTEVFEAQRIITLSCEHCASWTIWGLASHDAPSRSDSKRTLESSPAPAPRTVNERKHARVLTKMNACVRHAGLVDEVVRVKDASRGGFRFVSPNYHHDGSYIMVAMPYTRDASNIFVSARIIWRRKISHMKRYEYGVTYSSPPERTRGR
jgi:hypothetical protein